MYSVELLLALTFAVSSQAGCPHCPDAVTTYGGASVCRCYTGRYPYSYRQSMSSGFDYRNWFDRIWTQRPNVPSVLFSASAPMPETPPVFPPRGTVLRLPEVSSGGRGGRAAGQTELPLETQQPAPVGR